MEIKSLAGVEYDTLYRAFEKAFADYDLQQNKVQLQDMLKRRGFNPDLSFAAFEENEIIAFTLNGIGNYNGIPTAYDTGTGTLKEHRGKGLATRIFEYSIPYLKDMKIKQYLLEVLQHNAKAISVYKNLDFHITREFNYFMQNNEEVMNRISHTSYSIQQIDILDLFSSLPDFWDFDPSWQNSFESIKRAAGNFISLGVFDKQKLVGYAVFEPVSGDITQIAVDKENRRKGAASVLLKEIIALNKNNTIKIINTETSCTSMTHFLEAKNIHINGKQFEMIRKI